MRKLLVFNSQRELSMDDWEHYLYDTEASRAEFLDMDPLKVVSGKLSEGYFHYSEWDIALKESEQQYSFLHILFSNEDHKFVFDNPFHNKICEGLERVFRGPNAYAWVVVNHDYRTFVMYRMNTELSDRVSVHLPEILAHLDAGTYSEEVATGYDLSKEFVHADKDAEPSK